MGGRDAGRVPVRRQAAEDDHARAAAGPRRAPLERFLDETAGLGGKRGPILVQLPPSFAFDARVAGRFLTLLRARYEGPVVCEPRHATWASAAADALLSQHRVARVAADPALFPEAALPGGWPG